jgi:hypothetical protein
VLAPDSNARTSRIVARPGYTSENATGPPMCTGRPLFVASRRSLALPRVCSGYVVAAFVTGLWICMARRRDPFRRSTGGGRPLARTFSVSASFRNHYVRTFTSEIRV